MLSTKKNKDSAKSALGGPKKVIWEELYTDLSTPVAQALREARVKPDKLPIMSDDEIMAIQGLSPAGLEEIRSQYVADIKAAEEVASGEGQIDGAGEEGIAEEKSGPLPANKRHLFKGGKAIKKAGSNIDRNISYSIADAVKLVQDNTITKFDATLTLHLNLVDGKEKVTRAELTFPHLAGKTKKVAIATDELIAELAKGTINFDILITTPQMMPKLAKYAKLLGPKGLMPNPKNGTVTTDPEGKKKEFEAGKTVIKAESKFPLMHITVGKKSQKVAEIVANIEAVIEAIKAKNIAKATLASTMSPGVKLQLN
jgi:large subunit ribosomal protein L1